MSIHDSTIVICGPSRRCPIPFSSVDAYVRACLWFSPFHSRKAASNLRKHGISFQEAATVFGDPAALTFPDDLHSEDEQRFVTIGVSPKQRILFVSHQEEDDAIRIIGARRANDTERSRYENLWHLRSRSARATSS